MKKTQDVWAEAHRMFREKVAARKDTTKVEVDSLIADVDFSLEISRGQFEKLNDALFQKCMDTVANVLDDAKIAKKDVSDIVLVGGSTSERSEAKRSEEK